MQLLKEKDLKAIEYILEKFEVNRESDLLGIFPKIVSNFKIFPYENLTKILDAKEKTMEKKLRTPYYIVKDFIENKAGGTCFSLVYFLKSIFDYLGFDSYLVLADRKYGEDTHCAIVVNIERKEYLVDIGYLIYKPVELTGKRIHFKNKAYNFLLENKENFLDVYTFTKNGNLKFRYRIKKFPVCEEKFISAWQKSFEFDMMNHLVITKELSDGIAYLRDEHFHVIKEGKTFYKRLEDKRELENVLKNIDLNKKVFFQAKISLSY